MNSTDRPPPDAEQLIAWDRAHIWRPFTPMLAWMEKTDPLVIERAEGVYLIDTDGRRYIDGVSSLWCNVHGHRVPELDAAVQDQLSRVAHSTLLGLANVPSILLAKKLAEIAPPGLEKIFYSDNGSTAVEVACKMAYQFWANRGFPNRSRFIAFRGSYHGDTLGAVSVGGIPLFHQTYRPLCFPTDFVDPPRATFDEPLSTCAAFAENPSEEATAAWKAALAGQVETVLRERPDSHAAIIVEPMIQGAGGMLMHPRGTLAFLRNLADSHGLPLIFDEVMTGFGRTGKMFASDVEGVSPDILCLSKGLTGGYMPLGATLTTRWIFDAFCAPPDEGKTFYHGHTFTGHPLACATALASIELFATRRVLEWVEQRAAHMARLLEPLRSHPRAGHIRQRGLVAAIDVVASRGPDAPYPASRRVVAGMCSAMRAEGVLARGLADTMVLMPPLAIDDAQISTIVHALGRALDALPEPDKAKMAAGANAK